MVERVIVSRNHLMLTIAGSGAPSDGSRATAEKRIPWPTNPRDATTRVESAGAPQVVPNERLIQSLVRAHAWVSGLRTGLYQSIEQLAQSSSKDLLPLPWTDLRRLLA